MTNGIRIDLKTTLGIIYFDIFSVYYSNILKAVATIKICSLVALTVRVS